MRRPFALLVALIGAAVLLTGCDSVAPAAFACKVDVASADLVEDREAAGIASCQTIPATGTDTGLPAIQLDCLGEQGSVRLNAIKGPAVLNFWASNCGPCRKEMPALQEFHAAYGDQVRVIGVNYLDTYPGAAIELARMSGVTYPSIADACGDLQKTDAELGPGLPFFLFVSADGTVSRPHVGGVTSADEVVALVRDQLGIDLSAKAAK
ncbi:TlpA family protein disulfide reductase [Nocardioides daeguensis]|uniref:Thioredoxin domain-containing protein n=1 Tax=Nocardioides daeguensis TaxID=908359 RepID=A0ABP6UPI4_9ACTN|nr:TlpA disulfide reductase family protein [Nocardioides daeguensis]MBV6728658.1 TlpA family protein disulfide reductase [Nocardioides daeguensis]MCR1773733.1 TlpA family protein disulfide reductase [Nocardioides daeguensis]